MSTIHDYDANASGYEEMRVPAGVNHILGALHVKLDKPLSEIRVLDAGCGTGNYAKELLDAGVGHVDMLDASNGMLTIARTKLKKYVDDGRAHIIHDYLPTLPYPDGYFDCVLFIAVLYHLDKQGFGNPLDTADGDQYPKLRLACQEARRVLQPEGFMVTCHMNHNQVMTYLWMAYIPSAAEKYALHLQEYPALRATLKVVGFKDIETIAILDKELFTPSVLYDPEVALKEEFRKSLSYFSVATEEDIKYLVASLTEAKRKGTLAELMLDLDKGAVKFGRFCLMFAQ